MSRPATGQVVERKGKRGRTFALRFRAYGKRECLTLCGEGWTQQKAEDELQNVLADVRRGIWQPPTPDPVIEQSEPEVDRYRRAKINERLEIEAAHLRHERLHEKGLGTNTINKTLTRLSQILDVAVDYDLIPANTAAGKKRRLKPTRPRRPWVEPEQLLTLFEAAGAEKPLLGGRGRPLLATLAGAGLRIDEALSLERRDVNTAKGTLTIRQSKTDAGLRVVDLTPALRDELATYLDRSPWKTPTDYVFPTSPGHKDNRQNIRQRLFMKAIERANERLVELGLEPMGDVRPHGLRRTYASLRAVCGEDPVFIAQQIGHEDVRFHAQRLRTSGEAKRADDGGRAGRVRARDRVGAMGTNGHK